MRTKRRRTEMSPREQEQSQRNQLIVGMQDDFNRFSQVHTIRMPLGMAFR